MSNRRNIQFTYSPHNKLTILDCNFIVDVTNVNGLGLKSLNQSGRIQNVFMNSSAAFTGTSHTSTVVDSISSTANLLPGMPVQGSGVAAGTVIASITSATAIVLSAATSSSTTGSITYQGVGSPNPRAGSIFIQLQDNYNTSLAVKAMFGSPNSGTPILVTTGVTAGIPYVITKLGTTSAAQWIVLGVPANMTPAVGVAFVAPATATATGTGEIQIAKTTGAGVDHMEIAGNPNVMNSNGAYVLGNSNGMQLVGNFFKNTAITAVADGTLVSILFYLNDSAQGV